MRQGTAGTGPGGIVVMGATCAEVDVEIAGWTVVEVSSSVAAVVNEVEGVVEDVKGEEDINEDIEVEEEVEGDTEVVPPCVIPS